MGRILAIDFGMKRTGLAVSDPLRIIAGALETVSTAELERWIEGYVAKNEVDTIVVGKATRLDGSPSDTLPHAEGLVRRLAKRYPDKEVTMYDERFTSVMAQRTIRESGIGKMARRDKSLVDKVSATIILQGYMESKNF
ncbi:MAG: Holliday junction resolvase RuvX [Rikenellaceae bacterium]